MKALGLAALLVASSSLAHAATLVWDAVDGATAYEVYACSIPTCPPTSRTLLGTTSATSYSIGTPALRTWYVVVATGNGNVSPDSNIVWWRPVRQSTFVLNGRGGVR